jgi:hypothetical protein
VPGLATQGQILKSYGDLPLSFEFNEGQTNKQVKFLTRGQGYSLFLTGSETVIALTKAAPQVSKTNTLPAREPATASKQETVESQVIRMKLAGANSALRVVGADELPGKVNYFIGNDPSKWRTNVPTYAKVWYVGVYPGVDLVYYGNRGQLEYDFVVAPGSDPASIRLKFHDTRKLRIDKNGDLLLEAEGLQFQKPQVYQVTEGERKSVEGHYYLRADNVISFRVADYDHSKPLIIDPVFVYSTYLGGSSTDIGSAIAVDSSGNAYVAGSTRSINFPTADPLQPAYGGGGAGFGMDAYVAKLNSTGSALVYSTYLGGSDDDRGQSIAVDSSGNAYVAGITVSHDFPTVNPFQPSSHTNGSTAFVAKLNSTGSALVYSTYLGGSGGADWGLGIAVDSSGNAYVTGFTTSADFPTMNPIQPAYNGSNDAFVTKLNPNGSALVYSTYLGGSGSDAATASP